MSHTVVISDIHLCELERTSGLWMRYRQAPYGPDVELANMLAALRSKVRGEELLLVLNGDVFDFDAPTVRGGESVFHDLPRDAAHAVPMLTAMMDDHPLVLEALASVLVDGHALVFITGNHDVQLTLPEVREALSRRLVSLAHEVAEREGLAPRTDEAIASKIAYRAWFHRTDDNVLIEHGNQYDAYCAYRYPMAPFGKEPEVIQPTMGSLAARLLTSRMGYFNPHVDGSFMLSAVGYAKHWFDCYLFSRHSLVGSWLAGAMATVVELLRVREPGSRPRRIANVEAAMRETGASFIQIVRHERLFATPAEAELWPVVRELWLDRLALLGLTVAIAAAWLWLASGPVMAAALFSPALFVAYERIVPKPSLDATWQTVARAARRVGKVHSAAAVVFGHTHHAEGSWEDGVFFGNSGSWSAAYHDIACTQPLETSKPLIWLRNDTGRLTGGLMRWTNGDFTPATS